MKKIRYIVLRLHVKILLKISGFLSQIKLMQVSNCGYSTVKSKDISRLVGRNKSCISRYSRAVHLGETLVVIKEDVAA